jgi:hypothetical protein
MPRQFQASGLLSSPSDPIFSLWFLLICSCRLVCQEPNNNNNNRLALKNKVLCLILCVTVFYIQTSYVDNLLSCMSYLPSSYYHLYNYRYFYYLNQFCTASPYGKVWAFPTAPHLIYAPRDCLNIAAALLSSPCSL